jgi:hypothetical protein
LSPLFFFSQTNQKKKDFETNLHFLFFLRFSFFSFVIPDARFLSSSSTYYSDKRQVAAAQFWHFWFNLTLFSNRPNDPWSSIPRGFESPPTIGWSYRTDSQFSVEESVATPVYVQTSYGKGSSVYDVIHVRGKALEKLNITATKQATGKMIHTHKEVDLRK